MAGIGGGATLNQWDREQQQLADDLDDGLITVAEYNERLRQMNRDRAAEERDMLRAERGEEGFECWRY